MTSPTPQCPAITDNFLFEHFATLATAPDGIARLRDLILRLAIYGKLETHDTKDKSVKLKENGRNDDRSLGIFTLIDLPKGWVWTKLGSVAEVGQGGTPSTNFPEYWNGSVPWLRSGDIKFNRIKRANETISELGLKNSAARLCPIGTVLLAMTGQGVTRGRAAILDIETSANQSCAHIILDKNFLIPEFLFYFFKTEYWNIRTLDKGTGQPGINTKIIKSFDIPLPPLAEQHRIVAKVDRLMAHCDELEARQQQERAGCLKLGTASLAGLQNVTHPEEFGLQWAQVCDAFDLILDCPENVKVLRQTILQMAVQGRLVRQEPGDEPARMLQEKIIKDKQRLESQGMIKPLKFQKTGDVPPQILPKSWIWVTIGDLFLTIRGGSTPSKNNPSFWEGSIAWASVKDLKHKYIEKTIDTVTEAGLQDCKSKLIKPGNIIICTRMGLGKIAINKIPITINQDLKSAELTKFVSQDYFYNFYLTQKISGTGMTVDGIRQDALLNIPFPLPPLAEQHRIVAKVDALMALCDALESRLKERAGVQARLAGAVGKMVAGEV